MEGKCNKKNDPYHVYLRMIIFENGFNENLYNLISSALLHPLYKQLKAFKKEKKLKNEAIKYQKKAKLK